MVRGPRSPEGGKEKEREEEAADFVRRPTLIPRHREGYTLHNQQALAEHEAYIDCHVAAGTVSAAARASFVAGLTATIEANGGEDIRQQRLAEEHTSCVAAAAAKKTAIEQQAMVEAMGKGDGKGSAGKSFSARVSSIKYAPYKKSINEKACVASIVKVGINAAKAQES